MRNYRLYAALICTAAVLGAAGCSAKASASESSVQETTQETTVADTTVVESVTGEVESAEQESEADSLLPVRVYGPITKMEENKISIDNQSGVSYEGEIIINIDEEATHILDAVTGEPVSLDDLKDGSTAYVYVGPVMTMSLPPMTNTEMIFVNAPEDFKVPDYVEIESVVTDAATSKSVLTAADGTQYTLDEECKINPYLTRNIVTLDDLTQGRKCVVWSSEDNVATSIMLFAE